MNNLIEALKAADFSEDDVASAIEASLRPVIGVGLTDGEVRPGMSKLGGAPELPAGTVWPEGDEGPFAFLCQINLSEVDSGGRLPAKGLLSLFATCDESELSEVEVPVKLIFTADMSALETLPFPQSLDENEGRFAERALVFAPSFITADADDENALARFDGDDEDLLEEIFNKLGCPRDAYMFGKPFFWEEDNNEYYGDDDVLILKLPGEIIHRVGDDDSVYGEGGFSLILDGKKAAAGAFDDTLAIFET